MNSIVLLLSFLGCIGAATTKTLIELKPIEPFKGPVIICWEEEPDLCKMERRTVSPLPSKNLVILNRDTAQAMRFQGGDLVTAALPRFVSTESIAPYCLNADSLPSSNSQVKLRANIAGLYVNDIKSIKQPSDKTVALSTNSPTVWAYNFANQDVTFKDTDGYFLCIGSSGFFASKTYSDKCKFSVYEVTLGQVVSVNNESNGKGGLGGAKVRTVWG